MVGDFGVCSSCLSDLCLGACCHGLHSAAVFWVIWWHTNMRSVPRGVSFLSPPPGNLDSWVSTTLVKKKPSSADSCGRHQGLDRGCHVFS